MAGARVRIPARHRIFMCGDSVDNYRVEESDSDSSAMNLSDTVFEFLDDSSGNGSPESPGSNGCGEIDGMDENEDEERDNGTGVEGDKAFWENQHQLLRATLNRTSSLESRIRNATNEALKEAQMAGNFCACGRPVNGVCRDCLMREICSRLRNAGFNCAISKSKWRNSSDVPSGEHTFLDVIDDSNLKKGEVRVIIELNFVAEFEMARASEEYKQLIRTLPEVFVGKIERLQSLIKILCSAGKKCMKEKRMHLGPWRKHRYMQAKWLGKCERTASAPAPVPVPVPALALAPTSGIPTGWSSRVVQGPRPRPRASMLTVDLLENMPKLRCPVVEVV